MTIALITQPANEPLTIQDVKDHLRIDHDHEDALLLETLKAAREYAEFASGQKCITQTWRQYENGVPSDGSIALRVSPVVEITSIVAFDGDGNGSALDPQTYGLLRGDDPALVQISHDLGADFAANGLEIDAVVGFGDLGIDVPDGLKRAILLLMAHWYEFRGAVSPQDQPVSLPAGFGTLVAQYRRVNL